MKTRPVKKKTELFIYIKPRTKQWLKKEAVKQDMSVSRLVEKIVLKEKEVSQAK